MEHLVKFPYEELGCKHLALKSQVKKSRLFFLAHFYEVSVDAFGVVQLLESCN